MAQIIKFPIDIAYKAVRIQKREWHVVWLRVVDRESPEEARWHLQFGMQRAASFKCLKRFTDEVARRREWHTFTIGKTDLLQRFLIDIERLGSRLIISTTRPRPPGRLMRQS
jgi:hypothetical protein